MNPLNIISRLFRGPRSKITEESKEEINLANCTLGITRNNERYANPADKNVKQYLDEVLEVYNTTLQVINSGKQFIYDLFRTRCNNVGEVVWKYGMWWRRFVGYNYKNKNILVECDDLLNDKEPEKSILKINKDDEVTLNDENDNLTAAFVRLLKESDSDFPPSVLSHLARGRVHDNESNVVQELYCFAKACPIWLNLYISKKHVVDRKRKNVSPTNMYIQKQWGVEDAECFHFNGCQQQSKNSFENQELSLRQDVTKIGQVYSGIMAMSDFITDNNVDDVIAGIEAKGFYNLSNMQNMVKHLKEREFGFLSHDVDTITKVAETTYQRDLSFNNQKESLKNRKYYGEIRFLNWITPILIVMSNHTSNELWLRAVIDIFLDFTEGNVIDYRDKKVTELVCSMATALGGIVPYPLFHSLCHSPNAETVETSFHVFNKSQSYYTSQKVNRIIFIHVDKFKGYLPGVYYGFGHTGHHYNYLLDCIKLLRTMNYNGLNKYKFRLVECGVHNMLGLGKHDSHNKENMSTTQQKCHKMIMMECHRFINYSLSTHYLLSYYELLKYILTKKTIPSTQLTAKNYKYHSLYDFDSLIKKGMKGAQKEKVKEFEFEFSDPSERAKDVKHIKDNILDWDDPPTETAPDDNSAGFIDFLADDSIDKLETDRYRYLRIWDKYKHIYYRYDKQKEEIKWYPVAFESFITVKNDIIHNDHICIEDWRYYELHYGKTVSLTTHMIGGASLFPHNQSGETVNRQNKNQKKFLKKLTVGQYVTFTAANKEKDRRCYLVRVKDQVSRVAGRILQDTNEDLEDEDSIILKDNRAMEKNDEFMDLALLLSDFWENNICSGYTNCHKTLAVLLQNETNLDQNGKELLLIIEKFNKRETRLITRLMNKHKVPLVSIPVAKKLRKWLKQRSLKKK
eukprot:330272_1